MMFKSRKKRQQQQQQQQQLEQQHQVHIIKKDELEQYKLLDDLKSANDFRSSVILPQLGKDMTNISQEHLVSSPLAMPSVDGSKQYQDLAAWRHERSQHRYSNGLFGGKQRDRPKISNYKGTFKEEDEEEEEEVEKDNRYHEQEILREKEEDPLDKRKADVILEEEEYEPDSDMEENYFFKDFSAGSQPKQTKPKPRQKKTTITTAGGGGGGGGLFDLSSFARDLHDHRLSVVQPRESRIIMTEEDEQELEKLLTLQRQRMSMMTISSASSIKDDEELPPLPTLEKVHSYKVPQQKKSLQELHVTPQKKDDRHKEHENPKQIAAVQEVEKDTDNAVDSIKSHPIEQVEINKDVSQSTTATPSLPSFPPPKSPRVLKPAKSCHIQPVTSISASSIHHPVTELEPIKRSVSTTSIRSQNSNKSKSTKLTTIPEPTVQKRKIKRNASFRKSMSMDDISVKLEIEPSITSAALEWIDDDNNSNMYYNNKYSAGTNQQQQQSLEKAYISSPLPPPPTSQQPQKSLGLFGSLRQVSRSKTHSGGHKTPSIKGLVRNLSSSHHHYHHHRKTSQENSDQEQQQQQRRSDQGMSRAAMAVIQHNVAKHEQNKITPIIPTKDDYTQQTSSSSASTESTRTSGGVGILSQLLARASSRQRRNTTKTTNMEDEKTKDARKRAQVVRRTIIYVQPNSLHDLLKKNGGDINKSSVPPPPVPALHKSNTTSPDGSLSADDETVKSQEYVTATKVVRQASVRKRIVENTDAVPKEQPTLSREGSRKRWQLKSMDENDVNETTHPDYLEGVELREMSDGSVVWGIVKKKGNRKSFYSPQNNLEEEIEEDEEEEERQKELKQLTENRTANKQHLKVPSSTSSPPPIPKRSPRRQVEKHSSTSSNDPSSTTDIYYSDVSLPNLLQMMKRQEIMDDEETRFNERAMASVDEQLDEMMRSLTSQ